MLVLGSDLGRQGWSLRAALAAAGASLMLYCAGLIHNDLCDLREDARERPHRPLPSGRITPRAAVLAFLGFLVAGLVLAGIAGRASLAVAAILGMVIVLYNRLLKRVPVLGPVNMGLCRGLSLLLGAAAWGWEPLKDPLPLILAGVMTAYIAAVTAIAGRETAGKPMGAVRDLPACVLAFYVAIIVIPSLPVVVGIPIAWPFALLPVLATLWAAWCAIRLGSSPHPRAVQKTVGMLIRGLLLLQAGFCCARPWPGFLIAGVLLAFWPLNAILARRFYAS